MKLHPGVVIHLQGKTRGPASDAAFTRLRKDYKELLRRRISATYCDQHHRPSLSVSRLPGE